MLSILHFVEALFGARQGFLDEIVWIPLLEGAQRPLCQLRRLCLDAVDIAGTLPLPFALVHDRALPDLLLVISSSSDFGVREVHRMLQVVLIVHIRHIEATINLLGHVGELRLLLFAS